MRNPVLFSSAQLLLLFVQVAILTTALWILAFGEPWDKTHTCPTAIDRPSSVVGGMGADGRHGTSGGQP